MTIANTTTMTSNLRNLFCHAVNKLIEDGLLTRDNEVTKDDDNHITCVLFGKPSVIRFHDAGWKEVRVSLWWDFDKTKHPQHLEGGYSNLTVYDDYSTLSVSDRTFPNFKKFISRDSNSIERFNCSEPLASRGTFNKFVGVVVAGWIERKTDFFIQGNSDYAFYPRYVSKKSRIALKILPNCAPNGFNAEGQFKL